MIHYLIVQLEHLENNEWGPEMCYRSYLVGISSVKILRSYSHRCWTAKFWIKFSKLRQCQLLWWNFFLVFRTASITFVAVLLYRFYRWAHIMVLVVTLVCQNRLKFSLPIPTKYSPLKSTQKMTTMNMQMYVTYLFTRTGKTIRFSK